MVSDVDLRPVKCEERIRRFSAGVMGKRLDDLFRLYVR